VRVSPEEPTSDPPADVPVRFVPARLAQRIDPLVNATPSVLGRELLRRLTQNTEAPRVARLFQEFPAETIIHQHDFLANIVLTKLLARRHPVVWTNHFGEFLMLRRTAMGTRLLRPLTSHYLHAFAPSAGLADIPSMRGRISHLANGVDTRLFVPLVGADRDAVRTSLGFDVHDFVILIPRRWAPTKGVAVAARALAKVPPGRDRRVVPVFVGGGLSEYREYEREVREAVAAIPHCVKIVERLDHHGMVRMNQAADMTVIPSFLEATSLSALEAMSAGSVVVASDTGGIPELVSHGVNGILVPPGDESALAAAIGHVARLSDGERELILRDAAAVAKAHSWTQIAAEVKDVYEHVLRQRA
jgi:glycosyltransferase involved in cell wall biosynthesis